MKRDSSHVRGFGRRALGHPTFHLSRLTFHGSFERLFHRPTKGPWPTSQL